MALAGASGTGKGVDSTAETENALELGKQLATSYETVVAITGAVDLVRLDLKGPSSCECCHPAHHVLRAHMRQIE